jgi:hypothetical protein
MKYKGCGTSKTHTIIGKINNITPSFLMPDNVVKSQDVHFYVPNLYMGFDPYIRGMSYANMSLEIPADIDQIGSIPVNDYQGDPMPIGSSIQA